MHPIPPPFPTLSVMNKHLYPFLFWAFAVFLAQPGYAQYIGTPPVQDGTISDNEYGSTSPNNQPTNKYTTSDGGTWYMTWDANYLYVAKTTGSNPGPNALYEPNIMYLDVDPLLPVTGGGDNKGNLYGQPDYDVYSKLPFRADVRVFVSVDRNTNNPYIEVRRLTGDGHWSAPIQTNINVAYSGTNREFRLGWNTLTGGGTIPAAFNWLGYATNEQSGGSNYRYDQAPANPASLGTAGGSNPSLEYYYTIASTANGSATKPFLLKSYTVPRETYISNFGAIDVWDFTMNSPNVNGQQYSIVRSSAGGTWTISGSLVVGNGIVYFGSGTNRSYGDTNVGNIRVLGNGVLQMDETPKPILVREDVDLTGGGQFRLSGIQGGDLFVGRDFFVKDGVTTTQATFQPFQRTVTFTGGNNHLIQSNNTTYKVPFGYLALNTTGSVTLGTNTSILIGNRVDFSQGLLYTTSNNYVELDGSSTLATETAASHIIGNVRNSQKLEAASTPTNTVTFGNIGLSLTPQGTSAARGNITVTRVTGSTLAGVGAGSGGVSIQRYFLLTSADPSVSNLNLQLVYAYRPDELNGIIENNLALYQSNVGTPGSYTRLTMPPSANTSAHTITFNYQMALASGTYFTLGDGVAPLPVKLVSFTAKATSEGAAILRWNTASEIGSKGFGIERQLSSGEPWKSVGFVTSNNSATGGNYDFLDKSLMVASASTQAYYRLRQEDFNGTVSYSPVEVIARTSNIDATALVLSPVPVSGTSLSLTFAEAGLAGSQVTVSNTQGQRMLSITTETSADVALSLPVEKLAPGVYIVRVQVAGQSPRFARFVKQ